MIFYEGILFVTALENSGCSKVLEISSVCGVFCVWFFLMYLYIKKIKLHYTSRLCCSLFWEEEWHWCDSGWWSWCYSNTHHYRIGGEGSTFVNVGNSAVGRKQFTFLCNKLWGSCSPGVAGLHSSWTTSLAFAQRNLGSRNLIEMDRIVARCCRVPFVFLYALTLMFCIYPLCRFTLLYPLLKWL